ncbi:hypothetical protein SDJN03_03909, partial [Cucurbita argyrosperma subsp. sororia]
MWPRKLAKKPHWLQLGSVSLERVEHGSRVEALACGPLGALVWSKALVGRECLMENGLSCMNLVGPNKMGWAGCVYCRCIPNLGRLNYEPAVQASWTGLRIGLGWRQNGVGNKMGYGSRLQSLCDEINRLDFLVSSTSSVPASPRASSMMAVETRREVAVTLDDSANGKSIEKGIRKAWDSFGFIDTLSITLV